jgi:hypothetical protein
MSGAVMRRWVASHGPDDGQTMHWVAGSMCIWTAPIEYMFNGLFSEVNMYKRRRWLHRNITCLMLLILAIVTFVNRLARCAGVGRNRVDSTIIELR